MLGAWVPQPLKAKRRQSKCQHREDVLPARLQNADLPLRGGNVDHTQDMALAVPRELPPELLPLAVC